MAISTIDLSVIILYLVFALGVGVFFSKRAGKSVDEYLVGNRRFPWWLAGTSMIASAFAIDTPLGITGLVAKYGIQGVWFAWSYMLGGAGVLGAFIFASLLRRSRIITTAELIEVRYSGTPAAGLRLFKGVYFGILQNCIVMAWVLKAVSTFTQAVLGWEDPFWALVLILGLTVMYTSMAGIWGIATTDVFQYLISTVGTITLAVYAVSHVGGIDGLIAGLTERFGEPGASDKLRFLPRIDSSFFHIFLIFILLKWWGNPPGAITQRIVSSKDERHASWATLCFSLVHFALNYWPMILAALVSLVVYKDLTTANAEFGYAKLIVDFLPPGLLGLMLAAMMAAFMSTIDTHIHLGASYMVNDIYRRFLARESSEKHYVWVSRGATVLMLFLTLILAHFMESVRWAWEFLATMTAGYGTVVVVRWFWWRINAWGEISALGSSLALSQTCEVLRASGWTFMDGFGHRFLVVFFGTTVIWVIVTFLTPPTDRKTLVKFCKRVRPAPTFWGPIYREFPDLGWDTNFGRSCLHWLLGVIALMGVCFGTGNLLFGKNLSGLILWGIAIVCGTIIAFTYRAPYLKKNYETEDA